MRRSGAGFVFRRAGAQRVVLGAAFVTIALATTVLAMTSMYVGSVTETALRRTLSEAAPPDRTMLLSVGVDTAQELRSQDTRVRTALDRAFATVDASVYGSAVSVSYGLPVDAGAEVTDLAVFASYAGLRDRTDLVAGRWPARAVDGAIPVALSEPAARELDLRPGETVRLVNRLTDRSAVVSVTGVYAVREPESTYWLGDTLGTEGVDAGTSFTTYGPLVTDRQTFADRLTADATVRWRADPALGELTVDDLSALQAGVGGLTETELPEGVLVDSGIGELLQSVETPLLVGRSAVAMPSALLVLLAGYALFLTTRLLGEHRAGETALLRSRGMSSRQLLGHAVREALLLTLPAALAAPWLGALLLRGYDRIAPYAGEGGSLSASPDATTWLVAGLAAAAAAVVLVLPAWSSATYVQTSQARGRHPARSAAQRAGVDLLLLSLAGLAYWQLARYGSPLLADVTGQLAVDPLLVLAPALVLVAAAVVALRLLPLVSAVAERVAARSRGAITALGTWELSRRVRRHTGPALLLVLTTAIGTFSVTYAAAWTGSQQDQADFLAGADLRLSELPDGTTGADVRRLPGVVDAMPALRDTVRLGDLDAELVALDAASAGAVVELRDDLAATPLDVLAGRLVEARSAVPALRVPAEAHTLVVSLQVRTVGGFDPAVQPAVVLEDGDGMLHQVTFAERRADSGSRRLRVHLDRYAGPVRLVAVQVRHGGGVVDDSPQAVPVNDTLAVRLGALLAVGHGPLVPRAESGWQVTFGDTTAVQPDVPVLNSRPNGNLIASLDPGCCEQVLFSFGFADPVVVEQADAIPALVSSDLADTLDTESRGERGSFVLSTGAAQLRLRVAGVLEAVPTVEPDEAVGIVVDLPSLAVATYRQSGTIPEVQEWWLGVEDGGTAAVVTAVAADDRLSRASLVDRVALGESLRTEPVGAGILGALVIGSVAAATFAVIGFAVSISVSAGERRNEFALLRAIGAGPRQLTRMLGIEQAVLVGIGLVAGSVIGVLVARLVVPLVTLTDQAVRPFPAVEVPLPWLRLGVFAVAVAGLLAVALVGLTALLRRRTVTADLRIGADA